MTELKTQNEKPLQTLLLIAVVPIYLSVIALHWEVIQEMAVSRSWLAWSQLAAIGAGPVICLKVILALLVNIVDTRWKERLVHLRWHNPLPGSRSDKLLLKDARIDQDNLPPQVKTLLDDSLTARQRNALWYNNVYRPVRMTPAISNTHRRYLLHREAATGVFVVFSCSILVDAASRIAFQVPIMTAPGYLALFVYLALLIWAANQAGNRMVTGAIANFTSAKSDGGAQ